MLFIYQKQRKNWKVSEIQTYGKSKDLAKRAQSDKVLRDKAFEIAGDPKYNNYQRGLASMVYKFFDKKSSGSGIANEPNYQLGNELYKPIIKKMWEKKSLSDMESLSKCDNRIQYLLFLVKMRGLFL